MNSNYETSRLRIHILDNRDAQRVLDFLNRNRTVFEQYEAAKAPSYYTPDYQAAVLQKEFEAFLKGTYIRFYICTKEQPDTIIGTVSFQNFRRAPYLDATVGYKFDCAVSGQGYATEGVGGCIEIIFRELGLHRIEALIMPQNEASIRLAERLRFSCEGIAKQIIKIGDRWEDHLRYALINPEFHSETVR